MSLSVQAADVYTLGHFFTRLCERYGDRVAIQTPNRELTYQELDQELTELANAFRSMGLTEGDRIAVLMRNCPEFIISEIAAARAGVVVLPLNYKLSEDAIKYVLEDGDIQTVVVGPQFFEIATEIRQRDSTLEHTIGVDRDAETPIGFYQYTELIRKADETRPNPTVEPDDPVFLYYTGGTTGAQKGTLHTHHALLMNIYAHIHELELQRDGDLLLVTPLAHSADIFYKAGLTQGATLHLQQGFDTDDVIGAIEQKNISWTYLIPTMITTLLNTDALAQADMSSLETIAYGSAPIPPAKLQEGLDAFGDVFIQFYGLVEIPNLVTVLPRRYHDPENDAWLRSAGVAAQLADITILEPEYDHLDDRKNIGEIGIRAPYRMQGYLDDAHSTEGEWIRTGDVGQIDHRGRLVILDRIQDVILTSEEVVYSSEVENVLQRHSDVEQVAVIGTPVADNYISDLTPAARLRVEQEIKAVIVTTESEHIELEEIQSYCQDRLPDYAIPTSIDTVGQLPETPYGKTDKQALRQPYW